MMICEEHKLAEGQKVYPGQKCPWCERDALILQNSALKDDVLMLTGMRDSARQAYNRAEEKATELAKIANSANRLNGAWEKLVRASADQVYTLGKQLRSGDEAATGMTLQVLSTEMHRECQVIKGEEPLPHTGERLTDKRVDPSPMVDAMKEIEEKRKTEHCYSTYCSYLTDRLCNCLCRPCGEAKKKDH